MLLLLMLLRLLHLLSAFGASVLEPNLDSRFWQVDFKSNLFSHKDVRISCFLE